MDNLPENSSNFLHAKRVADTLTNFICSSDTCVSTEHVPYLVHLEEDREKLQYFNSEEYVKVSQ